MACINGDLSHKKAGVGGISGLSGQTFRIPRRTRVMKEESVPIFRIPLCLKKLS